MNSKYFCFFSETVTGLAYFVLQQNVVVDPTSVLAPSPDVLKTYVFSAVPKYKPYTGAVFLYQDAFCYADEGDVSVAKDNWNTKSGIFGTVFAIYIIIMHLKKVRLLTYNNYYISLRYCCLKKNCDVFNT